jgi:hypothetical protein
VVAYAAAGDLGKGTSFLSVLGVGVASTGAALLSGAGLGFLFGLPRTIDRRGANARLTTNTNLDQISDWLTKILVGLGLVQLGRLTHGLDSIGKALAPGLGNGPGAQALAVALLIYGLLDGFVIGYLWTRIDLSKRFRQAAEDLDPIAQAVERELAQPLPAPPRAPT